MRKKRCVTTLITAAEEPKAVVAASLNIANCKDTNKFHSSFCRCIARRTICWETQYLPDEEKSISQISMYQVSEMIHLVCSKMSANADGEYLLHLPVLPSQVIIINKSCT